MAKKTNWAPLLPVPRVSIVPHRICSYTIFEGLQKRKRSVPKLSGSSESSVKLPGNPYGFCELIKVNPDQLLRLDDKAKEEYLTWIEERNKPIIAHNNSLQNLIDNKATTISIQARKRIITALNWFYVLAKEKDYEYIVPQTRKDKKTGKQVPCPGAGQVKKGKFKLNMITLTLCYDQLHDDRYIKSEMLEAFIRQLKNKHELTTYIWRAERQENGRIHFHIITNVYVHHQLVRKYWNSILKTHGYIDAYIKTGGNDNPNSTDVHALSKIRKTVAYLSKYMAKGTKKGEKPIEGRQWFLSSNLSKIDPILFEGNDIQFENEITSLVGDKWKKSDYAMWAYVDIFSKDLANYPTLKALRDKAYADYSHLINQSCQSKSLPQHITNISSVSLPILPESGTSKTLNNGEQISLPLG